MSNKTNSELEVDIEQSPQLEWAFINWDTVSTGFAHNVFFSSQLDQVGRAWGFTLTFTTSPPPSGQVTDEQEVRVIRALAQSRVTIPYHSFKSMVDFALMNYESIFREDLPDLGPSEIDDAHENEV
jgi:hypothetical protein